MRVPAAGRFDGEDRPPGGARVQHPAAVPEAAGGIPLHVLTPRLRRPWETPPGPGPHRRLPQRGDGGVPPRRRGELLLHGDEHPHPGGAPGHGAGDGDGPGQGADPHRRREPSPSPEGCGVLRPRHRVPHQRRGSQRFPPFPGTITSYHAPAVPGCAWIRRLTPVFHPPPLRLHGGQAAGPREDREEAVARMSAPSTSSSSRGSRPPSPAQAGPGQRPVPPRGVTTPTSWTS